MANEQNDILAPDNDPALKPVARKAKAASAFRRDLGYSTVFGQTEDGHKFTQEGVRYDGDGEPVKDKANLAREKKRIEIDAKRAELAKMQAELDDERRSLS
jgi:hypothetical protein